MVRPGVWWLLPVSSQQTGILTTPFPSQQVASIYLFGAVDEDILGVTSPAQMGLECGSV